MALLRKQQVMQGEIVDPVAETIDRVLGRFDDRFTLR